MSRHLLITVAALALVAGPAWASGSGPAPVPSAPRAPSAPSLTPEQRASMKYNAGLKQQEKGDELGKEAEAATDEKKKAKAEAKARKAYETARADFEAAVKLDGGNFQAHGALGYVLRRLGGFDESLEAYERALQLKPGYPPAVEYRAEAFLGLNRVEEAKSAYMELFTADRPRADLLAGAMQKWIERRRQDPAGIDPATIDGFAKWLEQRREIGAQTNALLPPAEAKW